MSRLLRPAIVALALLGAAAAQGSFEASVDRRVIDENDVLVLELRHDAQVFVGNPDLSPLEEDFAILGSQRASQFTIVGGRTESVTTWTVTLQPRRRGELLVPALEYEGERTEPITVRVTAPTPDERAALARTVFFETEVSTSDVWVQEQLVYTVRLYYAAEAVLFGDLPPAPTVDNAVVRALGDSRPGSELRDGVRYNLVEQRYAVIPQRSGTVRIPPETFTGAVRLPEGGRTRRKNVRIESTGHDLAVRAQPEQWPAGVPWLPARDLVLEERWSETPVRLRAGEPATRTLELAARGVAASTLPEIGASVPDGVRAYPSQPALEEGLVDGTPVASRAEAVVLIANTPGALELPEVRVRWWDLERDETRVAVVPARRLEVRPATAAGGSAATPEPEAVEAQRPPAVPAEPTPVRTVEPFDPSLPWRTVAALLALAWLATGLAWWFARRRAAARRGAAPAVTAGRDPDGRDPLGADLDAVRRACDAGEPERARDALRRWRDALPAEAELAPADALAEADALLAALDRSLYGPAGGAAELEPLRRWLRRRPRLAGRGTGGEAALPPLHPES
ncbi:MAG: BatD family protein [Pseudomonadales bacterium]|nr:BatD family protein [Pseudomonadales bacterium]